MADLLTRYREGRCTALERQLIEDWYSKLAGGEEDYLSTHPVMEQRAEAAYRQTLPGLQPAPATPAAGKLRTLRPLLRWAAAAAVIGGLLWGTVSQLRPDSQPAATALVAETAHHQIKELTLPDGTHVWLNRASRLEWISSSDNKERRVMLSGEARFAVAPDPGKPFLVRTNETTTRVLGTEFNVEAYPGEEEVKVSLLSGKVAFADSRDSSASILTPGNMVRYRKKDGQRLTGVAGNRLNNWLEGAVSFNEVPVKDAVERIALFNQYKVNWQTAQLPEGTISAVFYKETMDQMLSSIAFSSRFRYRISEHSITIY